ncbi:MAG: SDR family NAD(P)-dependent oxidoreductase [Chromatiales bacterium]|jgi:NAD(P)-dependent dehydrogenase (short-subunit alcohol dehydrogenase family)
MDRDPEPEFKLPKCILVAGASGGIGQALCKELCKRYPASGIVRLVRDPDRLKPLPNLTIDLPCDILEEASIIEALGQMPSDLNIDMALLATGWLHDDRYLPEKTYKSLDADHLIYAFRVNAIGPALLIKHLIPLMSKDIVSRIGVLSARVGSISDNRLGGWHSYRASKAALNMLLKNYAIEMGLKRQPMVIVGLQPGTTETSLSAPYTRNVPEFQLQSPEFTATHILDVMERLRLSDSGKLYDFLGLPFEP